MNVLILSESLMQFNTYLLTIYCTKPYESTKIMAMDSAQKMLNI